jgi:tRNA(fMet)-specific endonuclease VapC
VTLRYLLDTNIISESLRPVPNQEVLDHLREHQTEIAIASVVWHELWYGCCRLPPSIKRTMIEAFLKDVVARTIPILSYDQRAALWHAEERARLAQIGRPPPFADGQIAAIAATNGLCLVTLNRDDYAAFQGLRLEDWRKRG